MAQKAHASFKTKANIQNKAGNMQYKIKTDMNKEMNTPKNHSG